MRSMFAPLNMSVHGASTMRAARIKKAFDFGAVKPPHSSIHFEIPSGPTALSKEVQASREDARYKFGAIAVRPTTIPGSIPIDTNAVIPHAIPQMKKPLDRDVTMFSNRALPCSIL